MYWNVCNLVSLVILNGCLNILYHKFVCAVWKPGYSSLHFSVHDGALFFLSVKTLNIALVLYILSTINTISVCYVFGFEDLHNTFLHTDGMLCLICNMSRKLHLILYFLLISEYPRNKLSLFKRSLINTIPCFAHFFPIKRLICHCNITIIPNDLHLNGVSFHICIINNSWFWPIILHLLVECRCDF